MNTLSFLILSCTLPLFAQTHSYNELSVEWHKVNDALPDFGIYAPHIDMTVITRTTALLKALLSQANLAGEDRCFIMKVARLMLTGPVYSDASARSRWNGYAKQSVINTLQATALGREILETLTAENPSLAAEIEAYSLGDQLIF